jgi:hypothetical protein
MTLYQIENYLKRQEIESQADTSSYNLRANVESKSTNVSIGSKKGTNRISQTN